MESIFSFPREIRHIVRKYKKREELKMDEKELENKNEQKETLDGVDIGEESVVTKHEIAMALFNFCHNIYIAFGIFILACRVLKFDMSAASGILFKAAYIAFAFLVLLFTACLRGEVKQKRRTALSQERAFWYTGSGSRACGYLVLFEIRQVKNLSFFCLHPNPAY